MSTGGALPFSQQNLSHGFRSSLNAQSMGAIASDSTHFSQQQRVISAPSSYSVNQPWQSVASRQPVVDPNYLVQTPTYSFSTPQMMPQIFNNAFDPDLPFSTYPQQSYMPGVPIHGSASSSTQSPLIYVSQQPTVNPAMSSDLTVPIAQRENIGLGFPTPVNSRDSQVTVQSAYHFPSVPTLSPLDISPTTYPQTDPTIFPNTMAGLPQTSVSPEANDKSSASASASAPASTSGPSRLAILPDLSDNVTYRRTSNSDPKAEGIDPVDSISDRLGEFLFSDGESPATIETISSKEESEWQKRRRTGKGQTAQWVAGGKTLEEAPNRTSLLLNRAEFDGLKDEHRNLL